MFFKCRFLGFSLRDSDTKVLRHDPGVYSFKKLNDFDNQPGLAIPGYYIVLGLLYVKVIS